MLESQKQEDILESNINTEEWRLELERVLPMLKVTVKSGNCCYITLERNLKYVFRNKVKLVNGVDF